MGPKWRGVYFSNSKEGYAIPLNEYNTVFQREVYAIYFAANKLLNENVSNSRICFRSDSTAAIQATGSRDVSRIIRALNKLGARNICIKIFWVKAHFENEDNKAADDWAKKVTSSEKEKKRCKIPYEKVKTLIKKHVWKALNQNGNQSLGSETRSPGCQKAKNR